MWYLFHHVFINFYIFFAQLFQNPGIIWHVQRNILATSLKWKTPVRLYNTEFNIPADFN